MALSGTILNIVITLGIVIISLFVLFLYLKLRSKKKGIIEKTENQRIISQCPDYWLSVGENECLNIHNIGNNGNNGNRMAFTDEMFQDEENGDLLKCEWAKATHTPWQFIDKLC